MRQVKPSHAPKKLCPSPLPLGLGSGSAQSCSQELSPRCFSVRGLVQPVLLPQAFSSPLPPGPRVWFGPLYSKGFHLATPSRSGGRVGRSCSPSSTSLLRSRLGSAVVLRCSPHHSCDPRLGSARR